MFLEKEYQRQSTLLQLLNKKKCCTIKELSERLGLCTKTAVLELENLERRLNEYNEDIYTKRKDNTIELVRHSSFNLNQITSQLKRETLYYKMVNFYLNEGSENFNHFLKKEFHSYSYGYKYRNHLKEILNHYNLAISSKKPGFFDGDEWQIRLFMLDFYDDMYTGEAPFFEDNAEVANYLKEVEKIQNKKFSYRESYLFRQVLYISQKRLSLNHSVAISCEWKAILMGTEQYHSLYTRSENFLQAFFNSSKESEILFLLTTIYFFHPATKFKNSENLVCESKCFQDAKLFFLLFQQEFTIDPIICDEIIYQASVVLLNHKCSYQSNLISEQSENQFPKLVEIKFFELFSYFMKKQSYSTEEITRLYPKFLHLCVKKLAFSYSQREIEICIVVKMKQEKEKIILQLNKLAFNFIFVEEITLETELVLSTGILVNNKNVYYCSAPLLDIEYDELKKYFENIGST
ncbi:helix-turn-helix domain-containing protein [Carnobacterium maltaromaticum]|uniref:Helix-turn-helix domain-containing protein n=1 Tax=Carnobacterium maltaromaticum TaxID=2751 RepID=A0AAW9JUF8_CARML|nr:helix-turn-helix domain-containing protein [Carnobacterium maltaromaticum]MDZ5759218.1 helix-turn-helix domain-containing protein [Carnobacterium maltaromaticum]